MVFFVFRLLVAALAANFSFTFLAIQLAIPSECTELIGGLLATPAVGGELIGNGLVLLKGVKACTLNRADVNEDILAAIVRLNEPVTLLVVEPLYLACSQDMYSLFV